MATIERQLRNQSRIANHFTNFKKTGRASMTQGACSARMGVLQTLWQTFEENHNLLEDDKDIHPTENYSANESSRKWKSLFTPTSVSTGTTRCNFTRKTRLWVHPQHPSEETT
ncbi:hypothetical protein QAD02_013183 [Eretmocerus hayati]|uniref:Uncharacterized protein n=1 Tax=Eretmocerus hayati TaxID=131215 RepID=A0ACC2P3J5_9HYME|nr:hypothetical protein QAD02_013183 [Eretmocerus hayati]